MKCPNCGGQMGLEDELCPYCGTPNAQAAQHVSDMARYRREYERTQESVMEETSFVRKQGSWLVILVVLLVALVVGVILMVSAWDIGYSIRESEIERTAAEDMAVLDSYLEQGEYGKFAGYYDANDISYSRGSGYMALQTAASAYAELIQYAGAVNNSSEYSFKTEFTSSSCERVADLLSRIYTVEEQYSYELDRYLPADKRVYLDDIRDRTGVIAKVYFGLTDEEIEKIPDVSNRKLAQMIEEGVGR